MEDCIIWKGHKDKGGYGVACINGKKIAAHRLALTLKLGRSIKSGMLAMHKCNNPSCVNPNHLEEGTHKENADYMFQCGLGSVGEDHAKKIRAGQIKAGLTHSVEEIIKIKKMFSDGKKLREVAKTTKIPYSTLQKIKYGKIWKNL